MINNYLKPSILLFAWIASSLIGLAQTSNTDLRLKKLSDNQSFIVVDDAIFGEYVGEIKAFPVHHVLGEAPVFTVISGDDKTFHISNNGLITVENPEALKSNKILSLRVFVEKEGYVGTEIFVNITVLKASECIFIDYSSATNGKGTRKQPYNRLVDISSNNMTLLFKRGTEFNLNGSVQSNGHDNILVGSYGAGPKPIIKTSGNYAVPFRIGNGSNGFIVRDLEITTDNPSDNGQGWGGSVYGYAHGGAWKNIKVLHNYIHHCSGVALISDLPEPYAENATIEWNTIHDIPGDGVFLKNNSGVLNVNNNHIERVNLNWHFVGHTELEANGDGIQTYDGAYTIVKHNYVDRTHTGNKFCIIIDSRENNEPAIVTDNYLIPTTSGDLKTWGVYVFFKNGKISRNYFKGGAYGIYNGRGDSDITVDYNIFDRCDVGIHDSKAKSYNNVFYGNNTCLSYGGNAFLNNIIYFTGDGQKVYDYWITINSDYNLINNNYANIFGDGRNTLFSQRPQREENSFLGDPLFIMPEDGDFRLQSTSPALGKGTDIGLEKDFDDRLIGIPPNLGAYDFNNQNGPKPQSLKFDILPNPNYGNFYITSNIDSLFKIDLNLFDLSGKNIYSSGSFNFQGQCTTQLPKDIKGLTLIRIAIPENGHTESHSIIIQ